MQEMAARETGWSSESATNAEFNQTSAGPSPPDEVIRHGDVRGYGQSCGDGFSV